MGSSPGPSIWGEQIIGGEQRSLTVNVETREKSK